MKLKMKTIKKILLSILMLFMMVGSIFAIGGNGQGSSQGAGLRDGTGNGMSRNMMHSQGGYQYQLYDDTKINHSLEILSLPKEDLSNEEISSLIYMREEEKLARDVYLELYDIYGMQIFSNIAKSEDKHTDAVKSLLDKYEIEDPVLTNERGEFKNETLQNLYLSLVAKGSVNLSEALVVGATVEDLDIKDLQDDLLVIDNSDITLVYENLMKGSRNHLRSFSRTLERTRGEIYAPVYISEEYFNEVISNDMETGDNYGARNFQNSKTLEVQNTNNINSNNGQNQKERSFFGNFWNGFRGRFN